MVSDAGEWEGADTVEHFLPPEQTCEIIELQIAKYCNVSLVLGIIFEPFLRDSPPRVHRPCCGYDEGNRFGAGEYAPYRSCAGSASAQLDR